MKKKNVIAGLALSAGVCALSSAGEVPSGLPFELEEFVNVTYPVGIATAPGDFSRIYVYTNPGKVHVVKDGVLLPEPFLDLEGEFSFAGERGFFGMAFDPDFQTNGTFYVHYAQEQGFDLALEKFQVIDADHADMSTRDVIYTNDSPTQSHYGGWIGFSPTDGYLYMGLGDGGPASFPPERAQNLTFRHGKILRIDPLGEDAFPEDPNRDYAIPSDNPFVGVPGLTEEIWAYGIRQPWRCSFDRNGDLWIGDVGKTSREEIDRLPNGVPGLNFGWPCIEGTGCTTFSGCDCETVDAVAPLHEYPRTVGRCVVGGYRYRGCEIPEIEGKYFFADFVDGGIFMAEISADNASILSVEDISPMLPAPNGQPLSVITSWGEDAYGELYLCDRLTNRVYKLVRTDGTPVNDCNKDGVEDRCQILDGTLADTNGDGMPDVCGSAICAGDCDASGAVDFNDLVSMLFQFGQPAPAETCDADGSGSVDFNDLVQALFVFGPCP